MVTSFSQTTPNEQVQTTVDVMTSIPSNEWRLHTDFDQLRSDYSVDDVYLTFDDTIKQRKEQHRVAMVEFRQKRKAKLKQDQLEHRRLEREMESLVTRVRATSACCNSKPEIDTTHIYQVLRELVVERETLRKENMALHEEITRRGTYHQAVVDANDVCVEPEILNFLPRDPRSGWRVHFGNGLPSFHFHPFTGAEYHEGMKHFDSEIARTLSTASFCGNFLGWNIFRAPLITTDNNSVFARVRSTKRVHCPLDALLRISCIKEKDLIPTIIAPIGFGIHQHHKISTQLLQEFDENAFVFVHNIPGPDKNLRYLYFIRRAQWQLQDGRRSLTWSMVIADSDSNRRSRSVEELQDDVEWATEGGMHITLTELNDTSVDVVCDRLGGFKSKLHAEYVMHQWVQYANWWEQTVAPVSLLL